MTLHSKFSTASTEEKMLHIIDWVKDKKGLDILALDISSYATLAEAVCLITATSAKHAQGLADHILDQCRAVKYERFPSEGYSNAQWILLDLNDIIVHIQQEDVRALYRLEDLWQKARTIADLRQPTDL